MKFIAEQKELHDALKLVGRAIRAQNIIPSMGNVMLLADNERLTLFGTDSDMSLSTSIVAGIMESGATTLPAKRLVEIISALPNETVQFHEIEENVVRLSCRRSLHRLAAVPLGAYPASIELAQSESRRLFVREDYLHSALRQCLIACSKDETRPVLTGIHLEIQPPAQLNGQAVPLRLTACDTHRLAVRTLPTEACELKVAGAHSAILPAKTITELIRALDAKSDHFVILDLFENRLQVETERVQFRTLLLDGKYPDFLRIRPFVFQTRWCVGKTEFLQVLKRVEPVAREDYGRVRLRNEGREKLVAEAWESTGTAYEETDVTADGKDISICFNLGYLRDAVTEMDGDALWLQFTDPMAPVLIRSATDPYYETMLNPMSGDGLPNGEE